MSEDTKAGDAKAGSLGVTRAETFEALSVGLIVGGSIVIPYMRRAVDRWSELETKA